MTDHWFRSRPDIQRKPLSPLSQPLITAGSSSPLGLMGLSAPPSRDGRLAKDPVPSLSSRSEMRLGLITSQCDNT